MASMTPPLENFETYRAARRVARLTTLCALVLGFVCLSLIFLLLSLFPLKQVQPMLVTFKDKGEQIVRIEPISHNKKAIDQLMESLCRQYVTLRETYDLQSEEERWQRVALMSSQELFQDFIALMDPKREDSPYKKRQQEKATRSVRIVSSASMAPSAADVFQVEWVSEDYHGGTLIGQERWLTTLTVCLEERTFNHEDQFINPIGFTVTSYTVARKGE